MPDANDMDLVREFARDHSEAAFTELVRRHINLVYSVARRCTGNDGDAHDVTQAVFIILARKAASLREKTLLTGWLYETTRFTAARLLRTNARRHAREQEAYMQSTLNEADTAAVWTQLSPHLEAAMGKLNAADRALLVLRFYENKSGPEAAALLGIREDAAHKRVARAIEKLRKFFAQRGVILSGAAIGGAVSANSVQAAPVALVKTISAVAIVKGSIATALILTLVKETMKTMTWSKMKTAMIVSVAVILAAGTTTLVAQHQGQPNSGLHYKILDDACQFADGFDQDKLVVQVLITSKNKTVHPADIHLAIQSSIKGSIPVQLGTNGQVLNFPHDETLRRENPIITSNLPKGTLVLTLSDYLPMPEEPTFPYQLLGDAVAEANNGATKANKIIKGSYTGQLPLFTRTIQGVIFVFPKSSAGKAKVEIASVAGVKEYTADANGQIKLKLEKSLLAENPEVTVSEKSKYVVPNPE